MKTLFLDLSFEEAFLGLFEDGHVLLEVREDVASCRHPCRLWQDLLDRAQLTLDDIDSFACGIGPGSYTGIRSAIAAVKGASFAKNKNVIGLSSLLLYAPKEEGNYLIASDARSGGVYCQRVHVSSSIAYGEPFRMTFSELMKEKETIVVHSLEWLEKEPPVMTVHSLQLYKGGLDHIAKIVEKMSSQSCFDLKPLYLRKTQVEEVATS